MPPAPFDPELAPVVDRGSPAEAVPEHRLAAEVLRQVFAAPGPWQPEPLDASRRLAAAQAVPAAVLIPLVVRAEGLQVALTRRTAHLHDHAGQISFPGGRYERTDVSLTDTALREAQEEIGLPAQQVEVLGSLPDCFTSTGYRVTPIVGLIHVPPAWRCDSFEVAEVFETPLAFLMNPAHHEKRVATWSGHSAEDEQTRHFYAMPWRQSTQRYFIWGATAAMLRNLYLFLRAQT